MISEIISNKIKEFEEDSLPCNPVYAKSQKDILDLIDLYWVDKYKENEYDSLGIKKFFYNIVENPTVVASKMIDLDTKDVRVVAEDGQSYYPAWFMNKDLHIWMKDKKNMEGKTFGQILNSFIYNWPKYGHLLVKKAKDTISLVPLQNIVSQQDKKGFLDSDYLIEKHHYSPAQFKKEAESSGWDKKISESIYKQYKDKDSFYVYELSGFIDGYEDNYFIVAEKTNDDLILFSDKKDRDKIYKELKWDDIPGRTLGRGQPEKLFEAQIHTNKISNYKANGLHWTSKHLYQTRDGGIGRNLLTETDNGDIIIANSEITPIVNEERNLHAYQEEEQRLDTLITKRTFSYDTVSGERIPAGTPLGSAILQTQMAGGYFDLKREDLGMFIKDILYDWIIPEFKKQKRDAHSLLTGEFNEEEITKVRNLLNANVLNKEIIKSIIKNKRIPSQKEYQILQGLVNEKIKSTKSLEIPKGFYDDLKYKIDVIITGEQLDVAARLTTLQTLMTIVGSNPTILQDPITRRFLFQMMDLAGVNPAGMEGEPMDLGGTVQAAVAGSMPKISKSTSPNQISVPVKL